MPSGIDPNSQVPRLMIPLIAALQCTYVLDFMLVMPLGPDLARALDFQGDQVCWLTAAYTGASLLAGLLAVPRLDHFDRRQALLGSLVGLLGAVLLATLSQSLLQLLLARALAGFCAAPVMASGMAILIDNTPPPQRGQAMARVMTGFSLATIAGIPLTLELAEYWSWQAPFLLIATLMAAVGLAACRLLPPQRRHLQHPVSRDPLQLLRRPAVRQASLIQGLNQFAAFLVIPSFSAFYLLNLDFPREYLGGLYLAGGITALIALQIGGRFCDRRGPWPPMIAAVAGFAIGLLPFFGITALSPMLCFMLFMAGNSVRTLCLTATLSHIPAPQERAGFMALQKLVQDCGVTLAAGVAAVLLEQNGGPLAHTPLLAGVSVLGTLGMLVLLQRLLQTTAEPQTSAEAAVPPRAGR